jgi:hypothetical protein
LSPVGLGTIVPGQNDGLVSWWLHRRLNLDGTARWAFDSLTLLASWITWKERNSRTFAWEHAPVHELYRKVLREADDWIKAGFTTLAVVAPYWSQNRSAM